MFQEPKRLKNHSLLFLIVIFTILSSCGNAPNSGIYGHWRLHIKCENGRILPEYTVIEINPDSTTAFGQPTWGNLVIDTWLTHDSIELPRVCVDYKLNYNLKGDSLFLGDNLLALKSGTENPINAKDFLVNIKVTSNLLSTKSGVSSSKLNYPIDIYLGREITQEYCNEVITLNIDDELLQAPTNDTFKRKFEIPNGYKLVFGDSYIDSKEFQEALSNSYVGLDSIPKPSLVFYVDSSVSKEFEEQVYAVAKEYENHYKLFKAFYSKNSSTEFLFQEIKL